MTRREHALYVGIITTCIALLAIMTVWTRAAGAQTEADCETFDIEPAASVWSPGDYDLVILSFDNGTGRELFDIVSGQRLDAPDGLLIERFTKCTYLPASTPTPTPGSPTPSPTPEPSSTPEPTASPTPPPVPSPSTTPTPSPTPREVCPNGLEPPRPVIERDGSFKQSLAARCKQPTPTPTPNDDCRDDVCGELPRTGTGYALPLTIVGSTLLAAGAAIHRGSRR